MIQQYIFDKDFGVFSILDGPGVIEVSSYFYDYPDSTQVHAVYGHTTGDGIGSGLFSKNEKTARN